jgi:hypothetical protein
MPSFLAMPKKTKTKRKVSFTTNNGEDVSFGARRKPKRRVRVSW